jgi:alkanesulfonate monooxygenase SsuD/methylene tetrahydromethanopterin reductase-like flavin-dependent oxidoreductase (luciferase family)
MSYVKFGLSFSPSEDYQSLARRWSFFEENGADSLWLSDHLIRTFKPDSPYRDAWSLLPALAAATSKAYVGVLVTCNSFRQPAVLARSILTVDEISEGRLIIGMGAGWYKAEHEILGLPFPRKPVRALRSSLDIITTMVHNESVPYFETPDYRPLQHVIIRPRPTGTCPILVGGHGPRILDIAVDYAQIWNSFGRPAEMKERNDLLSDKMSKQGLDPNSLERTIHVWRGLPGWADWTSVQAYQDLMGAYSEVGLTGFIFDAPRNNQLDIYFQCRGA